MITSNVSAVRSRNRRPSSITTMRPKDRPTPSRRRRESSRTAPGRSGSAPRWSYPHPRSARNGSSCPCRSRRRGPFCGARRQQRQRQMRDRLGDRREHRHAVPVDAELPVHPGARRDHRRGRVPPHDGLVESGLEIARRRRRARRRSRSKRGSAPARPGGRASPRRRPRSSGAARTTDVHRSPIDGRRTNEATSGPMMQPKTLTAYAEPARSRSARRPPVDEQRGQKADGDRKRPDGQDRPRER